MGSLLYIVVLEAYVLCKLSKEEDKAHLHERPASAVG